MPEITRRSFMALLAAAGVAVRAQPEDEFERYVSDLKSSGAAEITINARPERPRFTWTPDGGKPIPLHVMSVAQSFHSELIMDDDDYGAQRRRPLRSGEIEVETSNFWDCGDMRPRGTLRFTVGGQVVNVKADVWSCERKLLGAWRQRQRTTLSYQELTVEEA